MASQQCRGISHSFQKQYILDDVASCSDESSCVNWSVMTFCLSLGKWNICRLNKWPLSTQEHDQVVAKACMQNINSRRRRIARLNTKQDVSANDDGPIEKSLC